MSSFALQVKEEVIKKTFDKDCQKALLSGFLRNNITLTHTAYSLNFTISTISNSVARTLYTFLRNLYNVQIEIVIIQSQKLKRYKTYLLKIKEQVKEILTDLLVYDFSQHEFLSTIASEWKERELRAYIAGVFIACGSVNSPKSTNYHLEVQFSTLAQAEQFKKLVVKFRFPFKIVPRHGKFVCYIKKSLLISDFLKLIDAIDNVLIFEDIRISRDMTNSINRINNIDISNQQKSIRVGEEQIQMIKFLQEVDLFDELNDSAQKIALLRLDNPDASFQELADLYFYTYQIEISKSGVNHLFREIKQKFSTNFRS